MNLNPYRTAARPAPDHIDPDSIERPVGLLITAIIEGWVTTYTAYRAPTTLASFEELFRSFGADLSTSTFFVLKTPYIWWLFAIIGIAIAIWVGARPRIPRTARRKMKLAVRLFALVIALAYGFALYAIYLPIFKLGAVV